MQIDREKLKKQNNPQNHNQYYVLHDIMSSTNETQDKESLNMKLQQISPRQQIDVPDSRFKNGRFTIRKYKSKELILSTSIFLLL